MSSVTGTSFIITSSLLTQHHGKEILAATHGASLRVEDSHMLLLESVSAERILRAIIKGGEAFGSKDQKPSSSSSSSRPPSAGAGHSSNIPGSTLTTGITSDISNIVKRAESRGLRLGDSLSIYNMMEEKERPTIDEVEIFAGATEGTGECCVLILSCVDPLVDVVKASYDLVLKLQQRFSPPGRAQHIFAPNTSGKANHALHLIREAVIRQQVARGASTSETMALSQPIRTGTARSTAAGAAASAKLDRPPAKSYLVDMDSLYDFCFPHGQQFPMSTGRLILFALYGPLAGGSLMTGSRAGSRALTDSEILSMIKEVEQDDILAVYTAGSVMGNISEVLTDVRAASRGLPRLSRNQVVTMLEDLPRDSRGRCSFHDIQKRILGARLQRIEDMKVMFKPVASSDRERSLASKLRIVEPKPKFGRGKLAETLALTHGRLMAMERHGGSDGAGSLHTAFSLSASAAASVRSGSQQIPGFHQGDPEAQARHSQRLSAAGNVVGGLDIKHKMGPIETFRVFEGLLHRNEFMVAEIEDAVQSKMAPTLLSNTKIIRSDLPGSIDKFDRLASFSLSKSIGTRVPGSMTRHI
jgi:hypothetical protein